MKFYNKKKQLCLYMHNLSVRDLNSLKQSLISDIWNIAGNLQNLDPNSILCKTTLNQEIDKILELIKLVSIKINRNELEYLNKLKN